MEKAQIEYQIRIYYTLEFPCTETALDEIENHYELEDIHFKKHCSKQDGFTMLTQLRMWR